MASSMHGLRRVTAPLATYPVRRRIRGGLGVGLAVLLILAVACGLGTTWLLARAAAPSQVAVAFCRDLRAQEYAAATGLLDASLRGDGEVSFAAAMAALDGAEGPVVECDAGPMVAAGASASTAGATLAITRAKLGDLSGALRLSRQQGSWLIAGFATPLLGIDYAALQTTLRYCSALQAGDYATAYTLLAPSARGALTDAQYVAQARAHDSRDGPVRSCVLASVGASNSDTATQLTLTLTRVRLTARTGALTLALSAGAWRITRVDAALQAPLPA